MSEWRPCQVAGWEVSEDGQMRKARNHKPLRPQPHQDGYLVYCTHRGEQFVHVYAHQAVAYAWHGPCPPGLEVSHKDDNRRNNHYTNLEYITHQENCQRRQWPSQFVA